MTTLRPYQQEAIQLLRDGFLKHKRQILCLPTGSGKTVIFSEMVRLAYEKGTQVLIITDRIELCKQSLIAISNHNINPQILNADTNHFSPHAPVTLSMVETMARRMKKWTHGYYSPKLIVIDESHKSCFNKIIDAFPEAKIIGCSATPMAKFLHKYYTNIVNNVSVRELIDGGFLCEANAFQMVDSFDEVEVKRGEFVEKQLYAHYDKPKLYAGVIDKYKEQALGKKTLVFTVNILHADNTAKAFNDAGIPSKCVTSKTPESERTRIISEFKNGDFKVLVNANIFTTGFDEPSIECIIMNRATQSIILFLQCLGRGSRPTTTKKEFIVLDFGQNFKRHRIVYDSEIDWNLDPPKKKGMAGASPVKSCPKCDYMMHARIMVCPNPLCGYIFPEKSNEPKEGVLVKVQSEMPSELKGRKMSTLTIDEMVALSKTKAVKKPYIWRVVRSRGVDAIREYGSKMDYKEFWCINQEGEKDDSKFFDKTL